MKKIALWLTVMALGLCLGCIPESEPTIKIDLNFRKGQTVNLKIGDRGQIIDVDAKGREFELEIDP